MIKVDLEGFTFPWIKHYGEPWVEGPSFLGLKPVNKSESFSVPPRKVQFAGGPEDHSSPKDIEWYNKH